MNKESVPLFIQETDPRLDHVSDSIGKLLRTSTANNARSELLSEAVKLHTVYHDAMKSLDTLSAGEPVVAESLKQVGLYPDMEILNMMARNKKTALAKLYLASKDCDHTNYMLETRVVSLYTYHNRLGLTLNLL